jgi:hypothetical protein
MCDPCPRSTQLGCTLHHSDKHAALPLLLLRLPRDVCCLVLTTHAHLAQEMQWQAMYHTLQTQLHVQ